MANDGFFHYQLSAYQKAEAASLLERGEYLSAFKRYEELGDGDEPMEVMFCFVFNDIFGDYTMSEFISFEV